MPYTREHDNVVDNSPLVEATQGAGYTPAYEMNTQQDTSIDRMKQKMGEAKHRVEDKMHETAEGGIDRVAEGVHGAADRLRTRASYQNGIAADAEMKVADTMDRTAGYLREHESDEIRSDFERYVRKHPLKAVAGAIVAGYVLGRLFG